jgi:hypothetical protein
LVLQLNLDLSVKGQHQPPSLKREVRGICYKTNSAVSKVSSGSLPRKKQKTSHQNTLIQKLVGDPLVSSDDEVCSLG